MNVYALTPTGGRPEAMALLAEYVNAQTYKGWLTWVIVDDCDPATPVPDVNSNIDVHIVRPAWRWQPGQNTHASSLMVGLSGVPLDARLVMLEDDDVYLPDHISNMVCALDTCELAGEKLTRYYNVVTGRHRDLPGTNHASLSCTALKGEAIIELGLVCMASRTAIDVKLWRGFKGRKKLLDSTNVVGIKGMPGRPGIGVGHRANFGKVDQSDTLRKWIGDYSDNYSREAA